MTGSERRYRSFQLPESRPHFPPDRDFQTEHIKLDLSAEMKTGRIEGTATLSVVPLKEQLAKLILDACGLEVDEVAVDGRKCTYENDNERLVLTPEAPLAGRAYEIRVKYAASPSRALSFVQPDGAYPSKGVQLWTHSEAEDSRYWYPCHDYPDDKSTSEMIVHAPIGFVAISNGKLLGTATKDGMVTYHWREDTPHSTYLNSFVVGKFEVLTDSVNGTELDYYFPKEKRDDVMRYFGETPKMMRVFEELTGTKYPYAKYAQTTVEDFTFGGMEHISATTFAMRYYPDRRSEEDFQVSYSRENQNAVNLVAHELAHQWFGDLVTCSDWPHIWLNEAFATYFQCLYLEKTNGTDVFRWDMALRAELYFEEDESAYRRPIVERSFVFPDDLFDNTTYEKGAWMIHQLRYILGDKIFFAGIREYFNRFSKGNADTHDFRKVLESVSGLSLEEYFEEFFYKAGYPEFEVEYAWNEQDSQATLWIRQTQKTDELTPVFKLPCDVVFYTGKGRTKKKLSLSTRSEKFSFELDSKPRIVEFDPEERLLKKVAFKKSFELLSNQLRESIDASSRAKAAMELGLLKNNLAVEALREASSREQFWAVRARAIEALGEIGSDEALTSLLAIGAPENRRVRRAFAKALGRFKDRRAAEILERLLLRDSSPYVQCEAAISLVKVGAQSTLESLKKAMRIESPNSTLTEACLDGMGGLKGEEVMGLIRKNMEYGMPTRARIGALKAIIRRGFAHEDEVAQLKEILLHDKEFHVRYFVVDELIPKLGEQRFSEELKKSSLNDLDNRVRRRALEVFYELSGGAETMSSILRLKEEVERLKGENTELRALSERNTR